MAAGRDADTSQWLHNKLGSTDDLWSGSSVCSQMSRDRLLSVIDCFHSLQPHVKVKLMLSFLHLPKRNVDEWKSELEEILQMAYEDRRDQWVSTVGDMLKTFPLMGSINAELVPEHGFYHEALSMLKTQVKKFDEAGMLPLECPYLCRSALTSIAGQQPAPSKQFTLRRKPKSAALRAEILQKSGEAASNLKRNCGTTVPVRIRSFAKKMDDTTPLRGIPSGRIPASGGFVRSTSINGRFGGNSAIGQKSGVAVQKEGGIKLLDITEQPIGLKEAKRRKRMADQEAQEQQKKVEAQSPAPPAALMPDYAAGLLAPATLDVTDMVEEEPPTGPAPINYLPIAGSAVTSSPLATSGMTTFRLTGPPLSLLAPPSSTTVSSGLAAARGNLRIQLQQQGGSGGVISSGGGITILRPTLLPPATSSLSLPPQSSPLIPPPSPLAGVRLSPASRPGFTTIGFSPGVIGSLPRFGLQQLGIGQIGVGSSPATSLIGQLGVGSPPASVAVSLIGQIGVRQPLTTTTSLIGQLGVRAVTLQGIAPGGAGLPRGGVGGVVGQIQMAPPPGGTILLKRFVQPTASGDAMQMIRARTAGPPAEADQKKPGLQLTLSKDQMVEAQEMFRTSNKVTRPEKALILGFMAGSRDNPVPAQGDIVNIRLSEMPESVQQVDGTFRPMIVETYFQMNYTSGEWKRVRKIRELEPDAE